jgi:hypothetical protein
MSFTEGMVQLMPLRRELFENDGRYRVPKVVTADDGLVIV